MRRPTGISICAGVMLAVASAAHGGEPETGVIAGIQRSLAAEAAQEGPDSPYLLPLLEQLAAAQFRGGQLAEATKARQRMLRIAIAAFGTDAATTAEAMAALATSEIDRQRYFDAEALLIAAGNVLTDRLGADSQALIPVLTGLARIDLARGEVAAAKVRAERAAALMAANRFPRSAEPLRVLGAVYAAERRFEAGIAELNQAVAFDRNKPNPENTETARSLAQLGDLHLRAGQFAEALATLEEATAIDQAWLGANHPFLADDYHDIAIAYDGLKRPEMARDMLLAAIDVLEHGSGKESPRLAFVLLELSRVYRELGKNEAADTAFARARGLLNAAEDEDRARERRA
jgi:tetratricopeptide (TPR) repeat protein